MSATCIMRDFCPTRRVLSTVSILSNGKNVKTKFKKYNLYIEFKKIYLQAVIKVIFFTIYLFTTFNYLPSSNIKSYMYIYIYDHAKLLTMHIYISLFTLHNNLFICTILAKLNANCTYNF